MNLIRERSHRLPAWRNVRSRARWRAPTFTLGVLVALLGCSQESGGPASHGEPTMRALLVQGTAHADIGQWQEALSVFQRAAALDPAEPVAVFDIAVAHYSLNDQAAARDALTRVVAKAPRLLARVQHLYARLAYEEGDVEGQEAALIEAMRLDPDEAAWAHALAEAYRQRPGAGGALAERAHRLWPRNSRLTIDYAMWALAQNDAVVRAAGLAALEGLAAGAAGPNIEPYLEKGRAELRSRTPGATVPVSLRIVRNLLLAGKRFRSDAAALAARLVVRPITEPLVVQDRSPPAAPEVRFERTAMLPAPGLADGERIIAVVLVDDAVDVLPTGREAAVALLSDRGLYFLAREGARFERLEDEVTGRYLLAGDLDDDGRPELLLLTAKGLRRFRRGKTEGWLEVDRDSALATAGAFGPAILVDYEHDGDLDLLALDGDGRLFLFTHRGEAGLGPPQRVLDYVDVPIHVLASADLDGDADQDLILGSETELLVLGNWRQGEFAIDAREPLPGAPEQLLILDYDADGQMDLVLPTENGITFWRGGEGISFERDGAAEAAMSDVAPARLVVADIDLDGDPDLLAWSPAGLVLVVVENVAGAWHPKPDRFSLPGAEGLLSLDMDGDHDPDVLAWRGSELYTMAGHGAEDQGWLRLGLRGRRGKVPLDGRGIRVEVAFGNRVQVLEPGRAHVILGLGPDRPSVIKATWPNGISEYLFEPQPGIAHQLELSMRLEGSCPFLYVADGQSFRFVTDILGSSPLGMLVAPGRYAPADPEEYLRLPDWVRVDSGTVALRITEELREVTYLDQVELVAVDAPADTNVYNGEQLAQDPVRGLALRLLGPLQPPASVRDDRGREVLDVVLALDQRYLTNHRAVRRYQGAVTPHTLTIELPSGLAAAQRPALVLVGWLHWGNTSTNLARSQDPGGAPVFPYLEVPDGRGGWRRTAVPVGLPAGKTKPVVVDLGGVIDPRDPRLRLTTDFEVYWDWIAVGALRTTAGAEHHVHRVAATTAELRWGGFARWYRAADNGPYLFDYRDRRAVPGRVDATGRELVLSWQELEGYYTAFGPVGSLIQSTDDVYVVFGSGEEVALTFDVTAMPSPPDGWRRTYFLHTEGWVKDGDLNVACSQTVDPLPYRGMVRYPCPHPAADGQSASRHRSMRRWVPRDRLTRAVEAWAGQRGR